jgi:uncharacterized membrane protein
MVTVFHKPKTQNSDRLETNWKYKIVTVFHKLKILFCVFGLWKTVTILYFQLVEGGHYFVFSVCWRRSLNKLEIQNSDGLQQTENTNSDHLQHTENTK